MAGGRHRDCDTELPFFQCKQLIISVMVTFMKGNAEIGQHGNITTTKSGGASYTSSQTIRQIVNKPARYGTTTDLSQKSAGVTNHINDGSAL